MQSRGAMPAKHVACTSLPLACVACAVGVLGGMIGLGWAEFRLPLLIALFGFAALQAVIVNKALSLVVVVTALPARLVAVPWPVSWPGSSSAWWQPSWWWQAASC